MTKHTFAPTRRAFLGSTAVGLAIAALPGLAAAQTGWTPEHAVEVVVGVAPGGANDRTARDVEANLKAIGAIPNDSITVNKPGGGHSVALAYTISHAGDPHFLQVIGGVMLSNNILGRSPQKYSDVTPIAMLFNEQMAFAVAKDSKITDAQTLLDMLAADPGSVSFSISTGIGTTNHLSALLVAKAAGADVTKLKAVAFDSSSEGVTATLGGHIDVAITTPYALDPFVESGELRYIAVASEERAGGLLADTPTWKELGIDAVVYAWRSVVAPPGLTEDQVAYWDKSFTDLQASQGWKDMLAKENLMPAPMDSKTFAAFLESENARYTELLANVSEPAKN